MPATLQSLTCPSPAQKLAMHPAFGLTGEGGFHTDCVLQIMSGGGESVCFEGVKASWSPPR